VLLPELQAASATVSACKMPEPIMIGSRMAIPCELDRPDLRDPSQKGGGLFVVAGRLTSTVVLPGWQAAIIIRPG
jgi:hypothetical protein